MVAAQQSKLPFVVFQIKGALYGIASRNVREIVMMPPVTAVPNTAPEIRGVINLRGKVMKLIDLRIKLGLPPLRAELDGLIQLLRDREQDHRNWLAELEACVRERRPFAMARDPHKCKFGLWYDRFRAEDRLLRMTLPSMDAPHKVIHATADEALRRAERGDNAGALEMISARRGHELAALIKLFEESRRILTDGPCEVAIVLGCGTELLSFSADSVEAAEQIPEERIEPMPPGLARLNDRLQCRIGQRAKTNQIVLLLGEEFFASSAGGLSRKV